MRKNIFSRTIGRMKRLRSQAHNCLVDVYNPVHNAQDIYLYNASDSNNVSVGGWSDTPDYKQVSAMISYNPSTQSSKPAASFDSKTSSWMKDATQVIRLIIDPTLDIKKGAKIVVSYYNWETGKKTSETSFLSAGGSRRGQTAQIIFFSDEDYLA